ncbi:MAG: hypothetical protein KatS3mg089_0164 [Patescibacteria group bacterium]|nr:MAG: hypothetical protein KatS3mg089_0164 [Patescibacteria group bacterium]
MKRNVFLVSFLILIFISFMLAAFFIFHSKKNTTLSLQTFSAPQTLSTPLKEYKNSHFGFSLFYPQELNVSQSSLSMIKVKKKTYSRRDSNTSSYNFFF